MAVWMKTPDEVKLVSFDFTNEMPENVVLSTPELTVVALTEGGDANDIEVGTLDVVNAQDADGVEITGRENQWVQVLIGGGIDGYKYRLECEADASNGEHHRLDKDLKISEKAALVI